VRRPEDEEEGIPIRRIITPLNYPRRTPSRQRDSGESIQDRSGPSVDDTITPAIEASKVFHEIARGHAGDFSKNRWLVMAAISSPM
jgi:hypothetical protein